MKLWHKDLIYYLPTNELIQLWHDCLAIARDISLVGHTSDIFIDKVMDYPICHFYLYSNYVIDELHIRGYNIPQSSINSFNNYMVQIDKLTNSDHTICVCDDDIFSDWHTERYLMQCLSNLDEIYDCRGMTDEEYYNILDNFSYILY